MSAIAGDPRSAALVEGLAVAVPLRIWELEQLTPRDRENRMRWWAREAAQEVAHKGDVLMYGGSRRGAAAGVFNHLARGLAAGAYAPGGITFAGRHWCMAECYCPAGLRHGTPPPPDAPIATAKPTSALPRRPVKTLQL